MCLHEKYLCSEGTKCKNSPKNPWPNVVECTKPDNCAEGDIGQAFYICKSTGEQDDSRCGECKKAATGEGNKAFTGEGSMAATEGGNKGVTGEGEKSVKGHGDKAASTGKVPVLKHGVWSKREDDSLEQVEKDEYTKACEKAKVA